MNKSSCIVVIVVAVAFMCTFIAGTPGNYNGLKTYGWENNPILKVNRHFSNSIAQLGGFFIQEAKDLGYLGAAIYSGLNKIKRVDDPYYKFRHVRCNGDSSQEAFVYSTYKAIFPPLLSRRVHMYDDKNYTLGANGIRHITDLTATPVDPEHNAYVTGLLNELVSSIETFADAEIDLLRSIQTRRDDNDDAAEHINKGVRCGQDVAEFVLADAEDDGTTVLGMVDSPKCGVPGQFCTISSLSDPNNPVHYPTAIFPQFSYVRPFHVKPQDLNVPPPISKNLTDPSFRAELRYVRDLGTSDPATYQPENAAQMFWVGNAGSPVAALRVLDAIYKSENLVLSLHQTARLNYVQTTLQSDSIVANTYWKHFYEAWRPFQAWRYFNERPGDDQLKPRMSTPFNQEYPCGHCQGTSTYVTVYKLELGFDEFPSGPITLFNEVEQPQYTITIRSLSDLSYYVNQARLFGQMHIPSSVQRGLLTGIDVVTIGRSRA